MPEHQVASSIGSLKPGDASTAKVAVKGKGANLGLPGALGVVAPITAQLANLDDGACWESVFTTTKKNGATKVVAGLSP